MAMSQPPAVTVLSVHWGFGSGGVANYAAQLESVSLDEALAIRSLVFVKRGRQVDQANLSKLEDKVVVECTGMLDFIWLKRLRDELQTYRPRLVITHGFNGHFVVFIARLLGWLNAIPVATYHGPYHPMSHLGLIKQQLFDRFTDYYLMRHAAAILSVAGHEAQALVHRGVNMRKISVIHNGIADVAVPVNVRDRLREEWSVAREIPLIGVVSRLEPIKGVADAIEAMAYVVAECAQARMVIIGSGTQEGVLRSLVTQKGLDRWITFVGFRSDIAACLSAIDIFLLPSHSECHSIALLEAMRAARPIVATAVGGNVETVVDGIEGVLVPACAPARMAQAVVDLVRNRERAQEMGDAARRRFLVDFTADVSMSKTRIWLRDGAKGL